MELLKIYLEADVKLVAFSATSYVFNRPIVFFVAFRVGAGECPAAELGY